MDMIENYVCGGFEFDAAFDSGNLGKVELSKVYNEGNSTNECLSLMYRVGLCIYRQVTSNIAVPFA